MKPRILLVEDEKNIQEALRYNLEMEEYDVEVAASGQQALKKFSEQRFSLVILDIMIPEIDGYAVCERIRLENMNVPILFLTAKDTSADKIKGLKLGADDYVTKPFNLEEVLLRVQALVKRSVQGTKKEAVFKTYKFDGNEVNFATFEAKGVNGNIRLTKKEAQLLKLLIDRRNEVVSRQQILQYVWGYDIYPSTRTIDNFILSFRKYFEKDASHPRHFHSVRGVGYKFTD